MTLAAEGGCRCGYIRYRATGEPAGTSLCHCGSCRRSTGSASLAWVIYRKEHTAITSGELAIHESSPGVRRGFCPRCGASLTYERADRPGLFDFTTASLDEPERTPPVKEIWTSERLSWVQADPALPQHAERSTSPG